MDPIKISDQLRSTLTSYLSTTFNVNRDGGEPELQAALNATFDTPGALFNGPYLELTPPYMTSSTLNDLVNEDVLSTDLLKLPCFSRGKPLYPTTPLYRHQEQAIRKLCTENRNVVISSGTGSGKTECFLIPILNDLLLDKSPGVRAVLIYPLNALVNDQLDRLRGLLRDTDITFGRYTGELQRTRQDALNTIDYDPLPNEIICREQIQVDHQIPQILITNYAMLEYLLLRPADAPLFQQGSWKYIVLDEAHTYVGAKGIEVGLLLRRLKHRLGHELGETQCVATSATLTDDDADEAARFAETIFGETVATTDIVFGQVDDQYATSESEPYSLPADTYLHRNFDDLINVVRDETASLADVALLMHEIGIINDDQLSTADAFEDQTERFLWDVLRDNYRLHNLREYMREQGAPVSVEEAAQLVFGDLNTDIERQYALFHLIELGAIAREDEEKTSLLPARYHLFARPPQGIWVCLNPKCEARHNKAKHKWSKLFATHQERCDACGSLVYPLTVCRTCGQTFVRMSYQDRHFVADANPLLDSTTHYFTWSLIHEERALADLTEEDELTGIDTTFVQEERTICLECGRFMTACNCNEKAKPVSLFLVQKRESDKRRVAQRNVTIEMLQECPRCRDRSYRDTEIATAISLSSITPLSIVAEALYDELPISTKAEVAAKPGNGRKLLTFYDSRQGAARFAAFLQDVANSRIYRHIIPVAARELRKEYDYLPDIALLANRCVDIAWRNRTFHNDPVLSDEFESVRHLSRAQHKRLTDKLLAEILAELTTRRRLRQSLEAIGLLAIQYFEPGREPDFSSIAKALNMLPEQARTVIEYLLDDLRDRKIIALPDGVPRDAEVFGRNRFSPCLVRSNDGEYEQPWLGATPRHRRRQFMRKVLMTLGQTGSEQEVLNALNLIFDWLVNNKEVDLLAGSAADGYQLKYERLFFDTTAQWFQCSQCGRLGYRAHSIVCPQTHCEGQMQPVNLADHLEGNFYYQTFLHSPIPMRVEEHTAQLDSDKGRRYQEAFKQGDVNVLSCSTTFEMGIDLGDLQAVVMSNIPPTVANYRQRAGRAGRRVSGTAFILSWASDRPHDQTYFLAPSRIISGHVRVPHLAMENEFISQRHINAILFSLFLRYRQTAGYENLTRVGTFFDPQVVDEPHYDALDSWLRLRDEEIRAQLETFGTALGMSDPPVQCWIDSFRQDMLTKGKESFDNAADYYKETVHNAKQELLKQDDISEDLLDSIRRYGRLLERLRGTYLFNFMSDRGVLPSYSFPLHTVELYIPHEKDRDLRLQRDLRQAIREYAPGQEIVADKRIWRSAGLQFFKRTPQVYHYRMCENCNHLRTSQEPGMPISHQDGPCPVCGELPSSRRRNIYQFVTPDGFRASYDSGQPAGQYVKHEVNLTRSALLPRDIENVEGVNDLLSVGYDRHGELLYVNEGFLGQGFTICLTCGKQLKRNARKCTGTYRGKPCPGTNIEVVTLGFKQTTDTLHLYFNATPYVSIPDPSDQSFWLSLMYALIQGASQALQIERRDIDGVLQPRAIGDGWQQTIVLYDNVPGGAGHVKQIRKEIAPVVREALRICSCVECAEDTSCYHCLRDYNNQVFHHILKRGRVARFLESLLSSLHTGEDYDVTEVVALNRPRWILQQVAQARHHVLIAADQITEAVPSGDSRSWPDVIADLLRRGVQVELFVREINQPTLSDRDGLSLAHYLQSLLDRGLTLYQADTADSWRVIIDPDSLQARVLAPKDDTDFILNDKSGEAGLVTSIREERVQHALASLRAQRNSPVAYNDLDTPPNTEVINISRSDRQVSEQVLFDKVFAKPVKEVLINDRYLYDHYRICTRLGAYVQLAAQHGTLERVTVHTLDAGDRLVRGSRDEQNRAIAELKSEYQGIHFEFKRRHADHDRYLLIHRTDGSQARILLGKGLDFIHRDGSVDATYLIIQDPYRPE